MRRSIGGLAVVLWIALLTGCASPNMRHSTFVSELAYPNDEKAVVVFMRPSKLGYKINAAVFDDDEFIGIVPYRTKIAYLADPGRHRFMVVSEAADFLDADLASGRTYYVQVVPRMGAWRARFSLDPVRRSELEAANVRAWIEACRNAKTEPSGYEWARANRPSIQTKKQAYLEKWLTKDEASRPYLGVEDGRLAGPGAAARTPY